MLGELSVSRVTSLQEDSWKLAPGSLWILSHALLPFADFALAVLTHSCEYDDMPSPGSLPRES